MEHLGSAQTEAHLAALMHAGTARLAANQPALDFDAGTGGRPRAGAAVVEGKSSQLVVDVIRNSWDRLGFGVVDDEALFHLVLARLVEPTSNSTACA